MEIANRSQLCATRRMQDAVEILEAGMSAADPLSIMPDFVGAGGIRLRDRTVSLDGYDGVYTVAFGKAADSMSRAANALLQVRAGIIVVPEDSKPLTRGKKFRLYRAGHPYPDRSSVAAARAVIKFLEARRPGDFVLFLVSGGASSLLALPDGITLSDKMHCTGELLRCGAAISEINCVRKHISKIKGGRLSRYMKCDGASLIMSDVEGDDPQTIASGTTYMDSTTFGDAIRVIEKFNLGRRVHPGIVKRLQEGAAGQISETPKQETVPYQIIANNRRCLDAMEQRAANIGYSAAAVQQYGRVDEVACDLLEMAAGRGGCLVFGGEPVVRVSGKGLGGRSQEMVLRIARASGRQDLIVSAMGTDGIDGNTRAAGAIHGGVLSDFGMADLCIKNNDSHAYFQRYGGLIKTGHTNTNLSDIGLIISGQPKRPPR